MKKMNFFVMALLCLCTMAIGFVACSDDDDNVWPGNSTRYYSALKRHGVAAELHIFPTGSHGWGWNADFKYSEELRTALARWLKTINGNQ